MIAFLTRRFTSSISLTAQRCVSTKKAFLDTNLFQVEQDVKLSTLTPAPLYKSRLLVNNFLHLMMSADFIKSQKVLKKMATRLTNSVSPLQQDMNNNYVLNSYYSCTSILYTSLKSNDALNIRFVKECIDIYEETENSLLNFTALPPYVKSTKKEIHQMIILCLIQCYKNVKGANAKLVKFSMAKYINSFIEKLKVDPVDIINQLPDNTHFREIFGPKWKNIDQSRVIPRQVTSTPNPIDSYKDKNGFLSLDLLLRYITETRPSNYEGKLYEVYDNLLEDEKDSFINNYLEFNRSKQLNVESHCLDLVHDMKASQKNMNKLLKFRSAHQEIVYSWVQLLTDYLSTSAKKIENSSIDELDEDEKVLEKYGVYMKFLSNKALATFVISHVVSLSIAYKEDYMRFSDLAQYLSRSFIRFMMKEKSMITYTKHMKSFFSDEDGIILFSTLVKKLVQKSKIKLSPTDIQSMNELNLIKKDFCPPVFLDIDENMESPAFLHSLVGYRGNLLGVIKIHPLLFQNFKSYENLSFNKLLYLPMLCPPKEWISPKEGGYLTDLKELVIFKERGAINKYFEVADNSGQLKSVYESLDALGSVAWAINSKVFDVVKKVYEFDEGFVGIPAKVSHLNVAGADYHNLKSLRFEFNQLCRVAESLDTNGEIFYLPHSVDFRGRAYPMVSVLSHYQGDLVRAMMMFWFSKPLGKDGFNWLKYQLAGVYGMDKLGSLDRIKFADDNIESIIDSATNPLDGKMWWRHGEKPWQTLSLCLEINQVLKFEQSGGNIDEYRCRIPIHQDGSCNGLQHYAALGADLDGGKAVNLYPLDGGKTRGDVYTTVLEAVRRKVEDDFKSNSETQDLAFLSQTLLTRKLIKQTVMTTVYGVTKFGGTKQIYGQISDALESGSMENSCAQAVKAKQGRLSYYISNLVLSSISELFEKAKMIQDWLVNNCARVLNSFDLQNVEYVQDKVLNGKDFDFFQRLYFKPMMWTTLSGFPVVQLYRNFKSTSIKTTLQYIAFRAQTVLAGIDKRKQMDAIAPNFIHSIDGLHMLMTCAEAAREDVTFVSVHDSYWTYPLTASKLSSILREEFIRLHSSNIIEKLREDFLYTTKDSYQLVWIKNSESPDFIKDLKNLRDSYPIKVKDSSSRSSRSAILYHELKSLTNNDGQNPSSLIEQNDLTLYFQPRSSLELEIYDDKQSQKTSERLSTRKFTPILVPVKIFACPPKGNLDINQVRHSPYFFS